MIVDENHTWVILRNSRKMNVDENHAWHEMRFFEIVIFRSSTKKLLKNDPINVSCYWVKF